jgi:hypothetical protein
MLTREEAHKATGMKVSEIVDIKAVPGGYRVTTHDGQTIDLKSVGQPELSAPVTEPVTGGEVPDGSAEEVLTWVGDDSDRAFWALDAEKSRPQARKGLVEKLTKLVA